MILNRGVTLEKDGEKVIFDYSVALYPEGLNPDRLFYFNRDDVDSVVYKGFSDIDEERFVYLYQNWLNENSSMLKKGISK
ncbi:DUF4176 domain-containing protein [Streptococcus suis]|uniref:DUF4176 domain-containing protein n=1 Tax=Streptococcus suis TaxID=1307 RepID=UPI001EE737EF|nr:DUF4176 domain-containing protein [Streptococcus suis]